MKNLIFTICMLLISFSATSQSVFGKWKTIDDETGEAKSVVDIFEREGKVYGKIVEIFDATKKDLPCKACKGEDYNKPVLGMEIIREAIKEGQYYKKGTILDPQDGKVYRLRFSLDEDDSNILIVRGYIGFFYATQYWKRYM